MCCLPATLSLLVTLTNSGGHVQLLERRLTNLTQLDACRKPKRFPNRKSCRATSYILRATPYKLAEMTILEMEFRSFGLFLRGQMCYTATSSSTPTSHLKQHHEKEYLSTGLCTSLSADARVHDDWLRLPRFCVCHYFLQANVIDGHGPRAKRETCCGSCTSIIGSE